MADSVATLPIGYGSPGAPMISEWDAPEAIKWAYLANVYVYACARALAEDLSALPFRAGRDPLNEATFDLSSPLAQLLGPPPGGPSPIISPAQLWAWSIVQYVVTGRVAWEIVPGGRSKITLWPLPVGALRPFPSNGGALWWDHFEFGNSYAPKRLAPEQVWYHWRPSQSDWRQPESLFQAARLDISVAVMQDRYDYAFLKNDARPAAAVVHEAFADSKSTNAFKRQFLAEHRGPENAGKPIFVETTKGGAGVKDALQIIPLGFNQRDAEFIKRYEAKIQAICVAAGVPLSRLGDASGRTFSNASEEGISYRKRLQILAREFEDPINMGIAPLVGSEVGWFDFSRLEEEAHAEKIIRAGVPELVKTRVITLNEGRGVLGLPPFPNGDRTLTDAELGLLQGAAQTLVIAGAMPTGQIDAGVIGDNPRLGAPDPIALPSAPVTGGAKAPVANPTPEVVPAPRRGEPDRFVRAARRAHRRRAQRITPPASESQPMSMSQRERHARRITDRVAGLEQRFQTRMQGLFDQQMRETLKRLEGKRGRQAFTRITSLSPTELRAPSPIEDPANPLVAATRNIYDPDFWRSKTIEETASLFDEIVQAGAVDVSAMFDAAFTLDSAHAQAFIADRANQLAGLITDTTYAAIKNQLAEGAAAGEGIPDLAARIRGLFEQTYGSRAETVARTEVISAYNGSTYMSGQQLPPGTVAGMEWLATLDSRTRSDHTAVNGQVIPMGSTFTVGGHQMRYPGDAAGGPGETINCRCTVLYLTPDEFSARTGAGVPGSVAAPRG